MKCLLAVFVLVSVWCFATGKDLPSTLNLCKRNDPKLEECFRDAFQHALPLAKDGISEMGVPPIDPLEFGNITVEGNPGRSVEVSQKIINGIIYNVALSTIKKTDLHLTDTEFKMTLYVFNKLIYVKGTYELDGKILVLPITGHGQAQIDFTDIDVVATMVGVVQEKKGKKYIKVNDATVHITPKNVKFDFQNLFNGDERLQTEMIKLLNENWSQVFEELRNPYQEALAAIFRQVCQAVFDRFPIEQLFPA